MTEKYTIWHLSNQPTPLDANIHRFTCRDDNLSLLNERFVPLDHFEEAERALDLSIPFPNAIARYFAQHYSYQSGNEFNLEAAATNEIAILSSQPEGCIPQAEERDVGLIIGDELNTYNSAIAQHLLDNLTPEQRKAYSEDITRVLTDIASHPDTPVATLSPKVTQFLQTTVEAKINTLQTREENLTNRTQTLLKEAYDHLADKHRQEYIAKQNSFLAEEAATRETCATQQEITPIQCGEPFLTSRHDSVLRALGIVYGGGDITKCNPLPTWVEALKPLEAGEQITDIANRLYEILIDGDLMKILSSDLTIAFYDLYDELTIYIKEDLEAHLALKPLAKELKANPQGLPIIAPTFKMGEGNKIAWEGNSFNPYQAEGKTLSLNQVGYILEQSKPVLDNVPHLSYPAAAVGNIAFGAQVKLKVTSYLSVPVTQPSLVLDELTKAVSAIKIPSGEQDAYLKSISPQMNEICLISAEEMRWRWVSGLKQKITEASSLLYTNPRRAQALAAEVFVGSDANFIPSGLYDGPTVYLLYPAQSMGETLQHEIAHAAWDAFEKAGIVDANFMRNVEEALYKLMPDDPIKISDHTFVKTNTRAGSPEWLTDALKTFWTNPQKLKTVDPHLYTLLSLLHLNYAGRKVVDTAASTDPETGESIPEISHDEFDVTQINPFEDQQMALRRQNALEYYQYHQDVIESLKL